MQRAIDNAPRVQDEKKLWRRTFLLILLWLATWTPYAGVFLASVTGHARHVTPHVDMLPAVICKLSTAINPFIYGLRWDIARPVRGVLRDSYHFHWYQKCSMVNATCGEVS